MGTFLIFSIILLLNTLLDQYLFFKYTDHTKQDFAELGNNCLTVTKQTFAINLFQGKMSFTCETSTIEKDAEYRSETKNIQFLATMFILYSKTLVTVKTY